MFKCFFFSNLPVSDPKLSPPSEHLKCAPLQLECEFRGAPKSIRWLQCFMLLIHTVMNRMIEQQLKSNKIKWILVSSISFFFFFFAIRFLGTIVHPCYLCLLFSTTNYCMESPCIAPIRALFGSSIVWFSYYYVWWLIFPTQIVLTKDFQAGAFDIVLYPPVRCSEILLVLKLLLLDVVRY